MESQKKTIAVIQSRMGSSRLPGKVMMEICNKPLLELMLERLSNSKTIDEIVVATTNNKNDDVIFNWAVSSGYSVFRGNEFDCLDRHYQVGKKFNADYVAKITPDCPLIDPEIVDEVIGYFLEHAEKYDYVSNAHPPSYPDGLDFEIFHLKTLEKAWKESKDPDEREHTTTYMWKHPELFRLGNVIMANDESLFMEERWTVDYIDDFKFVKEIYDNLYHQKNLFLTDEILNFLDKNPEIRKINQHLRKYNAVH
ncbi:glycosyltransferase family protein [Nitrosopumilus sp.]|nr:glycosyltransferase family protein [Nitrosopumilus sp.]